MGVGQLRIKLVILSSTCHLVVAHIPPFTPTNCQPGTCNGQSEKLSPYLCYIPTSSESGKLNARPCDGIVRVIKDM